MLKRDFDLKRQRIDLERQLINACRDGNLDEVKHLLTSPLLEIHPDINCSVELYKNHDSTPLITAVENNHMAVVEYLLTSTDLKSHADINQICSSQLVDMNCPLGVAACNGQEEMVRFLLYSEKLKERAQICPILTIIELVFKNGQRIVEEHNVVCHAPLEGALMSENINIIDMIVHSPEFNTNEALLKEVMENIFNGLFTNKKIEMFTHLLLTDYIEIDSALEEKIEKITDESFKTAAEKLISTIQLTDHLNNALPTKLSKGTKTKI